MGADGFIQGGVFGEVVLGGEFGEPEVEDGLGLHRKGKLKNDVASLRVREVHQRNTRTTGGIGHASQQLPRARFDQRQGYDFLQLRHARGKQRNARMLRVLG